jgi:tRNA modification GTPase
MYDTDDTIAAIATAAGGAARAIVRVSGPDAVRIVAKCFSAEYGEPLERCARATAVAGQMRVDLSDIGRAGPNDLSVECDLYLWPDERSYTRSPVAELHTIGSPPLVDAVLATVCRAGARLAEPGEFTLRAFLAGRIDLTQAEAVLGVIDASGNEELTAALAQLAGGLARPLTKLRHDLLQLLAELEAGLDFVDEDIRFLSAGEIVERLTLARRLIGEIAEQMAGRSRATADRQVVLVGPPNVGKSSLFNALVGRAGVMDAATARRSGRALVSPAAGTTRDYLTAELTLGDVQCELVDTAGVAAVSGDDAIESFAQSLAAERREKAAIRIWCVDVHAAAFPLHSDRDLVVITKADLARSPIRLPPGVRAIVTSSVTGQGFSELCDVLRETLLQESRGGQSSVVTSTAERCRESVRLADEAIARASDIASGGGGDELVAAELRVALEELGKVVGAVYTNDLLDRIFGTFCIGK